MKKMILTGLIMTMAQAKTVEMYDQPQNGRLIRLVDVNQLSIMDEYVRVQDMQTKMIGYVNKKSLEQTAHEKDGFISPQASHLQQTQEEVQQKMALIKQSIENRRVRLNEMIRQPGQYKQG